MRWKAILLLLFISFLAACGNIPKLSPEEYNLVTNRMYKDVTQEQVLKAAEELFRLADGDDFKFLYSNELSSSSEKVEAKRKWMLYYVLGMEHGVDFWTLTANSTETGVHASVRTSRHRTYNGHLSVPLSEPNIDYEPISGNKWAGGETIEGTAIYELFWARMDYLLGKRQDWMTCEFSDDRIKQNIVWGDNDLLCNILNIKDHTPTAPVVTSTQ